MLKKQGFNSGSKGKEDDDMLEKLLQNFENQKKERAKQKRDL